MTITDRSIKDLFPEWRDAIIRADGLVIVTPEYNHGYPGTLKAVLDLLLREYVHKAVAFVGVSAGIWGGTRVIEAMVPMVRELGLAVDVLLISTSQECKRHSTRKENFWIRLSRNGPRIFWMNWFG